MKLKSLFLSLLLFFVVFGLVGCGIMKKTKTITKREKIIKIDTVIRFVPDTVTIVKYASLHDTVKIENMTASARSYFNPVKQKIVLELKSKPIDVPLSINQHVITHSKVIEKSKKCKYVLFALVYTGFLIGVYVIMKKYKL